MSFEHITPDYLREQGINPDPREGNIYFRFVIDLLPKSHSVLIRVHPCSKQFCVLPSPAKESFILDL